LHHLKLFEHFFKFKGKNSNKEILTASKKFKGQEHESILIARQKFSE
jgi:hypothetical protein